MALAKVDTAKWLMNPSSCHQQIVLPLLQSRPGNLLFDADSNPDASISALQRALVRLREKASSMNFAKS